MKPAIAAENASFRFGGEASLPLQLFLALRAQGVEVRLLTHARTEAELRERLSSEELTRVEFVRDTRLHRWLFRLSRYFPARIGEALLGIPMQMLTQLQQRRILRRWIRDGVVDMVHQPIPVAPRFPSALSALGAPLMIGPLNGGMEYPSAFRSVEKAWLRQVIAVGRALSGLSHYVFSGKREAAMVLVANERTRQALPASVKGRVLELVENGVDLEVWKEPSSGQAAFDPKRFVYVGRLVDWKALDIVLKALVAVPEAQLEMIGEGPMREPWTQLAIQLGVADRVHWHGWQPHSECARWISSSSALVLPSLFECGGAVVLEAMAMGVPAIATRWGGPADYLDAQTGFLIEPLSEKALVEGFAGAMQQLIASAELRTKMGNAARRKIALEYSWKVKAERILSLYEELIPRAGSADKHKATPVVPVAGKV